LLFAISNLPIVAQLTNSFYKRKESLFIIGDIILGAASLLAAFLFRFNGTIPSEYQGRLIYYLFIFIALNLIFLSRERMYSFIWSFVGVKELGRLIRALTYAGIIFGLIVFVGRENFALFSGFPRSVVFLSYILSVVFIGLLRIAKRLYLEFAIGKKLPTGEPTLIVGAGRPGEHLIRNLLNREDDPYRLIGIVDDKLQNQGISIHGIPVIGFVADIPKIAADEGVKHIIIAFERDNAKSIREAIDGARAAGITDIKIVPEFADLLGQAISFRNLKEISVEDLLGRDAAKIDTKEIQNFIHGRDVLVTGACGSIGAEICRQAAQFLPNKLMLVDFNESGIFDLEHELKRSFPTAGIVSIIANVADEKKMDMIMAKYKPEVVFHAAAYKHVPLMEYHPEEAVVNNIFGTLYTARAALKNKVKKFVLISTDKAVNPISVMGKTKRATEIIVSDLNKKSRTKFVTVRFGNVLASRGSVIPLFQEQIKYGGPVTVTHPDMVRYFMTISEAALLVMEAGAVGKGGELFLLDMGKPVKIIDLAKELIRLSGYMPDVDIPITITGIRPGEKIFEELLTTKEGTSATKWEKIFISKNEDGLGSKEIIKRLTSLEKNISDPEKLKKELDKFIGA